MRTGTNSFPKTKRIAKRADYLRLGKFGNKVHTRHFLILWTQNHLAHSRLGITITKKVTCAVGRNRLKRHLKEAFRLGGDIIPPGLDLIVIAKRHAQTLRGSEIKQEFLRGVNLIQKNMRSHLEKQASRP
jgi:ribonuclease P protein component